MSTLRALSFSQPWLWAVLYAKKLVENRKWAPPIHMIEQRIALHAAKSWDKDAVGYLLSIGVDGFPARRDLYPVSCIVGVATIDRVVTKADSLPADQRRWFFGPYGWILKDVQLLATPVPATGKLGLWTVEAVAAEQVFSQLSEAA